MSADRSEPIDARRRSVGARSSRDADIRDVGAADARRQPVEPGEPGGDGAAAGVRGLWRSGRFRRRSSPDFVSSLFDDDFFS